MIVVAIEHSKITDELLGKIIMSHALMNLLAGGVLFVIIRMKSDGGFTDASGCKCHLYLGVKLMH